MTSRFSFWFYWVFCFVLFGAKGWKKELQACQSQATVPTSLVSDSRWPPVCISHLMRLQAWTTMPGLKFSLTGISGSALVRSRRREYFKATSAQPLLWMPPLLTPCVLLCSPGVLSSCEILILACGQNILYFICLIYRGLWNACLWIILQIYWNIILFEVCEPVVLNLFIELRAHHHSQC